MLRVLISPLVFPRPPFKGRSLRQREAEVCDLCPVTHSDTSEPDESLSLASSPCSLSLSSPLDTSSSSSSLSLACERASFSLTALTGMEGLFLPPFPPPVTTDDFPPPLAATGVSFPPVDPFFPPSAPPAPPSSSSSLQGLTMVQNTLAGPRFEWLYNLYTFMGGKWKLSPGPNKNRVAASSLNLNASSPNSPTASSKAFFSQASTWKTCEHGPTFSGSFPLRGI